MREILFRGKRFDDGEWVYGFYSNAKGENGRFHYIQDENSFVRVDPSTVGQCIGQIVINKKCFDGDICKFTYEPNPEYNNPKQYSVTAVVEWSERDYGFVLHNIQPRSKKHPSRKQYIKIGDFRINGLTIIGNIHDNPEVQKGGDCEF